MSTDVFLVPGSWFQSDPNAILPTLFVRLTYAALDLEEIPVAISRFNNALREVFLLGEKTKVSKDKNRHCL